MYTDKVECTIQLFKLQNITNF